MTDCTQAEVRDLLPDWVHGTLAPSARRAVAEHLRACRACAAEAEMLRAARAVMDGAPAVDVARITAAVTRGGDPPRVTAALARRRRRVAPSAVAALAAVVLGVAVASVELGPRRQPAAPDRAPRADRPGGLPGASGELQMGGGIGDLADDELRALLDQLERVDALPPDTPEPIGEPFGDNAI